MKWRSVLAFVLGVACCLSAFGQPVSELDRVRNGFASSESPPSPQQINPKSEAQQILSQPLYRDDYKNQEDWWLGKAVNRMLERLLPKNPKGPQMTGNLAPLGFLIKLVIFLLFAALIGFLIFLIVSLVRGRTAKRRSESGHLMSEEEALLSADEWLAKADRLAAEGRFREAVRCLYVAMLARLDEYSILRLERHETNWEHLYRFRDLPRKPEGFDLATPTQRFDAVWYGLKEEGSAGVDFFRSEYQKLMSALGRLR